ncbi:MAG: membrane-bound O-acyltransferase family protein [Bacteroidetes bacterium 4572_77]|nr:MAG: membrane-bound O-acyltransferase family protein [Bacteroidetes bacterium 4572_77]
MLFSSIIFLYAFLPIVLLLNFVVKKGYRNKLLLISSLIFFAWGGISYALILISSIIINYISGRLIHKYSGHKKSKIFLAIGISLNLLLLGHFKYSNFLIENINYVFSLFTTYRIEHPGIILPLGISFYTFQAMSYIIDLYRGQANVQKNIFKLGLYISFFPQLIAGPIVRYKDIELQFTKRKNHKANLAYGIQRFVLGLAKKVLIANPFGLVADQAFAVDAADLNSSTAWIGILAYTIQIYFDFSGYSDMAIGLGRMFGFKLPENFNFPYISRSIREFWQRWHMTLSVWFKNYLYFPLGGSRKGETRTIINLLIVFFATSIWHGASWNFVIWGMTHGFFMMLERLGFEKILDKLWRPVQHFYALFIIVVTRVFFRAETFDYAWGYFKSLFSFNFSMVNLEVYETIYNVPYLILTIIAILSATPFWKYMYNQLSNKLIVKNPSMIKVVGISKQTVLILAILIAVSLSTVLLISDSYNPFIYFRF